MNNQDDSGDCRAHGNHSMLDSDWNNVAGGAYGVVDYLLLGPMAAERGGAPLILGGFRQRAVLAVLLLAADRAVDIDTLIEQVWDGAPPPKPISSLRAYVANLRRILADDDRGDRLVTDARGYRLQLGSDRLDTREFETQIGHGKRLLDAGDAAEAGRMLEGALHHWRGGALTDFRDQPFANHEIHRLEALRADAVEACFDAGLQQGRDVELIAGLEAAVAESPMRERLWGQLMLAMYRAGRRTDALSAFERLQAVLDTELGVRPGLTLERLAAEIRNESPDLKWQPPVSPTAALVRSTNKSLYGRTRELGRLRDTLTAAADGRGSVAVLTGDSGVGKTALAAEAADLAEDLGMTTVWAGHSAGVRTSPAWAWTQVLRGIAAGRPRVAVVPVSDKTDAPPEVMANAVAEMVGRRPTLIVLDDLHRADRFTRDVLELLASSVQRMPLTVLATWQDGGVDRPVREREFDRLLSRCEVTSMRLRGIDRDATAALIENVTGVTPTAQFVETVEMRTGGNPFYIKELTRLLRDNGRLDGSTVAIAGDDVPDAVTGVIRRRMAGLPRATRSMLLVAALLGAEFLSVGLSAVLGVPVSEVAANLEPALRSGLIGDLAGQPGGYRFSHGLVRDAIAAQLTGIARAAMHADIARAYAGRDFTAAEDSYNGADHAWRAGSELDVDTALALHDRALTAGWERSAYREVADLCVHALDVCARLDADDSRCDREAHLWLQLASVEAVTAGQNSDEVKTALARASEIGSRTGQFTTEAAFRCLEACSSGRYHEAAILADGLVALYQSSGDAIAGSAGYYLRGLVEFARGHIDTCIATLQILVTDVPVVDWQRHGHLAAFDVRGYGVAAWAYSMRGDLASARTSVEQGIAVAHSRNDVFGLAILRTSQFQLDAIGGQHSVTAQLADKAFAELTELGIHQLAATARIIGGWARAMGPDGVDTSGEVRQAIATHAQDGTRIFLPLYYQLLSDIEAAHGDKDAARLALETAEAIAVATGERVWDTQLSARKLKLRADSFRSGAS